MVDRRLLIGFDWVLVGVVFALGAVGIVNLYSAASSFPSTPPIYLKQLYWFLIGLGVMGVISVIGYHRLCWMSYLLYAVVVGLLAAVLVWGKVVGGARRWLVLGPVVLQPSEPARLVLVLVLAYYLHRREDPGPLGLGGLMVPVGLVLVPVALIAKEPDLGTSILCLLIAGSVILVNGVRLRTLLTIGAGLIPAVSVGWSFLKDYQKKRIFSFLNPESDPLGAAYHLIQSKIAVGSGGFMGKGFMAGTQSQLHFLPEQHTDFAFSVLAEEWGFVGAVVVLGLVALLVYRGLVHAMRAKDRAGMLCVVGAVAMIFWPAVINIGMVIGLFPVVGIPLPFISYGGSSLVTTMAAVGLIEAVATRRYFFHRP